MGIIHQSQTEKTLIPSIKCMQIHSLQSNSIFHIMCDYLTPANIILFIVIIEVLLQCFTESFSLIDLGKSTYRGEI